MPADLTNPFGESCCDGGSCSTTKESAQPCGCDLGCEPVHYCNQHGQSEEAFKAGYHCRWDKETGHYNFDPAMAPGDPDGAYQAWLASKVKKAWRD